MTARYIVGDVFDVLATLEAGSVDLVVSSPPFLALRSYLPADHPDKAREIGSEPTPGAYLDTLLDVVEACGRVLAPHGSLVFELGDTYVGSGGAGGDYTEGGLRDGAPGFDGSAARERGKDGADAYGGGNNRVGTDAFPGGFTGRRGHGAGNGTGWPLDKSKVLIPQLFAVALAYGFNPLTGRQTEKWRVRNTVAWCRPNPPVGRDGDKFRPATSFLTVACKARDRYWDGDAVRQINNPDRMHEVDNPNKPSRVNAPPGLLSSSLGNGAMNPAGAPLLDYWVIPTEPFRGAHYATFPRALVVPLVKAVCPSKVCRECGEPVRRIVQETEWNHREHPLEREGIQRGGLGTHGDRRAQSETLGFTDCGHDNYRPGLVLDPFAGSGTTLAVASGHGLDSIGVDLDARNADLARERVGGLLLQVEDFARVGGDNQ